MEGVVLGHGHIPSTPWRGWSNLPWVAPISTLGKIGIAHLTLAHGGDCGGLIQPCCPVGCKAAVCGSLWCCTAPRRRGGGIAGWVVTVGGGMGGTGRARQREGGRGGLGEGGSGRGVLGKVVAVRRSGRGGRRDLGLVLPCLSFGAALGEGWGPARTWAGGSAGGVVARGGRRFPGVRPRGGDIQEVGGVVRVEQGAKISSKQTLHFITTSTFSAAPRASVCTCSSPLTGQEVPPQGATGLVRPRPSLPLPSPVILPDTSTIRPVLLQLTSCLPFQNPILARASFSHRLPPVTSSPHLPPCNPSSPAPPTLPSFPG